MMAGYTLRLELHGTQEELKNMMEAFMPYCRKEKDAYFDHVKVNGKEPPGKIQDGMIIEAEGPYGSYSRLSEVDVFKDIADASPDASFTGKIDGFETYAEQTLECEFSDRVLQVRQWYLSNDEPYDAYEEKVREMLPVGLFSRLFGLEEESEDAFNGFIELMQSDYDFDYTAMTYEDFLEYACGDVKTSLDEAAFQKALGVVSELSIPNFCDFHRNYVGGERETFAYTPKQEGRG